MLLQIDLRLIKDIADTQTSEITPLGAGLLVVFFIGIFLWRVHKIVNKCKNDIVKVTVQRIDDAKESKMELIDIIKKVNVNYQQMIDILKEIRYDSRNKSK